MASLTELQTFCQSLQDQISKLEVLVSQQAYTQSLLDADAATVAFGDDIAQINDPIFEGIPETLEETREILHESPRNPPVLLKSPKDNPKEIIDNPKDTQEIPKELPGNNLYPLESVTGKLRPQ